MDLEIGTLCTLNPCSRDSESLVCNTGSLRAIADQRLGSLVCRTVDR